VRASAAADAIRLNELTRIISQSCPTHTIAVLTESMGRLPESAFGAGKIDVAALGVPSLASPNAAEMAFQLDSLRPARALPFWQLPAPAADVTTQPTQQPHELRQTVFTALAHGAGTVIPERWRARPRGSDQYGAAILRPSGPGDRYRELKQLGHELQLLGEQLSQTEYRAPVALLASTDTEAALGCRPTLPGFSYPALLRSYHAAIRGNHCEIDVIGPRADLSGYQVIIAPAYHLVTPDGVEPLLSFVRRGGSLLLTALSGHKNATSSLLPLPWPGLLLEAAGIEVDDWEVLQPAAHVDLEFVLREVGHAQCQATIWCDHLRATTAQTIATYREGNLAGLPAVTVNRHGEGRIVYAGTIGNDSLHQALATWLLNASVTTPILQAGPGIEVISRWHQAQRVLFILNRSDAPQGVELQGAYIDLQTGNSTDNPLELGPHQVRLLAATGAPVGK
jgi:beta-galactosidase